LFHSVLAVCAACSEPLPEPPDTDALEQAYATPTASIAGGDAEQLGPVFETVMTINDLLGRDSVVSDGSTNPIDEEDPETGESATDLLDLKGRGFLRITHVCPGWPSDMERTRETTGAIETTVRFDSNGLDGVFWGIADQCKLSKLENDVLVDGELTIVRSGLGAIVALDGLISVDSQDIIDGKVDYSISDTGLDYRHTLGDRGHVLINIDLTGVITVRAVNGVFTCTDTCEPVTAAARAGGLQ